MISEQVIKIKRGFVDRPWGQLHYRTAGNGPVLVLTHKTYFSSRSFLRAIPLLAPHFRVIVPDTPGQGESENPPTQWTIPQYASDLLEVLDTLKVEDFYLVGNSTGAAIACEAAVICSSRIKKLLLFGMPRWKDSAARQDLRRSPFFYGPPEIKDDGSHYSTNWQRIKSLCVGYPPECFEIYFQEVMSRKERTYEGIEAVLSYSEASRLPLLTVPTLLMWAMEDTMFTPFIEDTARLVPHSTTKVLHGSPLMYLRDPKLYCETLLKYLLS
ncbi:alpha/beta fold hydrolase [Scytonema sp. UIC 10036]|nr:alpha/beta hydrolase [Scytonema sp. UIC 10036]MUG99563.1 alpha/beta fold hydrolase [Scytonema sp. UIC 10036]